MGRAPQSGFGMGTLAAMFIGGLLVGVIATKTFYGGNKKDNATNGMEMSMYAASEQTSDNTL